MTLLPGIETPLAEWMFGEWERFFELHRVDYSVGRGVGCTCGSRLLGVKRSGWVTEFDVDVHRAELLGRVDRNEDGKVA